MVKRAYRIDDETGTELWKNSIAKEILKVDVAYLKKEETPEKIRIGEANGYTRFQEFTCNIIVDVKMKFSRKDRMVENRAMNEAALIINYSSIVSKDTVSLDLLIAGKNDLYIKLAA